MDDWAKKTDWMREVGAVEAAFSESGRLLSVKLAPSRPEATSADEDAANQSETRKQALERLEQERRRLVFGASGGLVKRPQRDPGQ